jgi:phospholipid-binding lipoprotein MlaA
MKKNISTIISCCFLTIFIAVPSFSADLDSHKIFPDHVTGEFISDFSINMAYILPSDLRNIEDEGLVISDNEMLAQAKTGAMEEYYEEDEDLDYLEDEEDKIADPIEGFNRVMFHVNDKLYFWFLKPVAKGYSKIVPERIRIGVRNMFNNLGFPIRVVNNLLQLKGREAFNEYSRFGLNSSLGLLGFFDIAKNQAGVPMHDEDFGQTLGKWGAGPGFYITWPILGPSSLRDTVGFVGDYFLDPVTYVEPTIDRIAIKAGDKINRTSLVIGDYEEIKKDALDPYLAIKDIYHQYRQSKIDR